MTTTNDISNMIGITSRNQALQACAYKSRDQYDRENLQGVHFNSKHAVATDGHKLVLARKAAGEPDNVTIKFSKPVQSGKKESEFYTPCQGHYVGLDPKNVGRKVDGEFPDYLAVVRPSEGYNLQISLNAELLLQLAEALNHGSEAKGQFITLELKVEHETSTSPIIVAGSRQDAVGILMPARLGRESPVALLKEILE
jgi:DNA polymerase III sliding clamp (beta) subunit (PCNA family)